MTFILRISRQKWLLTLREGWENTSWRLWKPACIYVRAILEIFQFQTLLKQLRKKNWKNQAWTGFRSENVNPALHSAVQISMYTLIFRGKYQPPLPFLLRVPVCLDFPSDKKDNCQISMSILILKDLRRSASCNASSKVTNASRHLTFAPGRPGYPCGPLTPGAP